MPYSFSPPPYSSTSMGNENIPNVGTIEFPVFSTQNIPGGISGVNEVTPNAEDATPTRRKSLKWTISQNLVLLGGWIKYGTDSLVGINQKKMSHIGDKLLSTITNIALSILLVMELCAGIITTT